MSKTRVYELARELNLESKALIAKLKSLEIEVASHQSTLTNDQVTKLKTSLDGSSQKKVVVRRRRKAAAKEEPTESEVASAASTKSESSEESAEPSETPKAVVRKAKPILEPGDEPVSTEAKAAEQPKVEETEVAAKASPEKIEEVAELVAKKPELEAEDTNAAVKLTDEQKRKKAEVLELAANESRRPEAAKTKITTTDPEAKAKREAEAKAAEEAKKKTSKSFQGATIVRKATPEEVKTQKKRSETSTDSAPRRGGPPSRSRDSQAMAPMVFGDDFDASKRGPTTGRRARGKGKGGPGQTESAEELLNQPVKKEKRTSLRNLLEADPDQVVVPARKRRTVYTPAASSRKRDLKRRKDLKQTQITTPRAAYRVVKMEDSTITVGDLAKALSVKAGELIKKLMADGIMATINQPIDFDTATLIANEYSYEVQLHVKSIDDILGRGSVDEAKKESRPPIVTVMGHVDHGKTSILDALRKTEVVSGEAGGITQHIGAYTVEKDGKKVAFLDTPGHAAFSSMRSRGAKLTDIIVLVVAADDGVMPQTVEAISHANEAGVPVIVAVNKIDKPNINVERVYSELAEHGIQSEDWGGENQFVKVSAIERTGLDELVEAILLQSELLELEAPSGLPARGVVVEANLDKGRGPVATVMVTEGTLKKGSLLVAGKVTGRVRAMTDHKGKAVIKAGPSTPVEIIGLTGVPEAGDQMDVVEEDRIGREISEMRIQSEKNEEEAEAKSFTLEDLMDRVKAEEILEVPFIVKADTQGSVEAIAEALLKIESDKVKARIVHKAPGGINATDVSLAQTSGAVIVGFNVRAERGLDDVAQKQAVLINYFSVIYELVDTVKSVMAGQLPPVQSEVIQGHAEVRDAISVPKIGTIAGSAVLDGKITRSSFARIIRDSVVVHNGKIGSLRRFKDDVKEVANGYECGIGLENYNDIKIGDVIEAYRIEESAAVL